MSDVSSPASGTAKLGRSFWIVIAIGVVAVGTLGSYFGARNLALDDVSAAHQNLQTSSVEIASDFNLAIQHEQDLAISAGAFVIENPNASESSFTRWVNDVNAFKRYPEILAVAEVDVVRPSQLSAFAARATANARESGSSSPDLYLDAAR